MRIHEAAKAVGCTQRAIKFYEEKGLLPRVPRSENGYRDYSEKDIARLHEIQAYRKLGISLSDIRNLLTGDKQAQLALILAQKKEDAAAQQKEIEALEDFLQQSDAKQLNETIDFASIAEAMRSQLPGCFGAYLAEHFAPYLQTPITTEEQKDAYMRVLDFWDRPDLSLPLLYRLSMLAARLLPPANPQAMDASLQALLSPDEETYERICTQTLRIVRMREHPLLRLNPVEALKRRMMRSLRDCGYYDLFIPQLKRLSPAYRAYHDALTALNDRLCHDLGLYYDSDFHLRFNR